MHDIFLEKFVIICLLLYILLKLNIKLKKDEWIKVFDGNSTFKPLLRNFTSVDNRAAAFVLSSGRYLAFEFRMSNESFVKGNYSTQLPCKYTNLQIHTKHD